MPQLSRQQATRLSLEAKMLAAWAVVRDFASQVYGENRVAKVEIATHEEYDDENYSYPIGRIAAYDGNGREIQPDYTLPFFQLKQWKGPKNNEEPHDTSENENEDDTFLDLFKDLSLSHTEKQRGNWVLFGDLPDDDHYYDLTEEPVLSLPTGGT
jgi:hypothetical protein